MQRLCNTVHVFITIAIYKNLPTINEKSLNYDMYKPPISQQLIWTWASHCCAPLHNAASFCMRVIGHIVRVSVRMQMNAGVTRAMREGWHVCCSDVVNRDLNPVLHGKKRCSVRESHSCSSFAFSCSKTPVTATAFSRWYRKHGDVSRRPNVRIRIIGVRIIETPLYLYLDLHIHIYICTSISSSQIFCTLFQINSQEHILSTSSQPEDNRSNRSVRIHIYIYLFIYLSLLLYTSCIFFLCRLCM